MADTAMQRTPTQASGGGLFSRFTSMIFRNSTPRPQASKRRAASPVTATADDVALSIQNGGTVTDNETDPAPARKRRRQNQPAKERQRQPETQISAADSLDCFKGKSIANMGLAELRRNLETLGLSTQGSKAELAQRLRRAVDSLRRIESEPQAMDTSAMSFQQQLNATGFQQQSNSISHVNEFDSIDGCKRALETSLAIERPDGISVDEFQKFASQLESAVQFRKGQENNTPLRNHASQWLQNGSASQSRYQSSTTITPSRSTTTVSAIDSGRMVAAEAVTPLRFGTRSTSINSGSRVLMPNFSDANYRAPSAGGKLNTTPQQPRFQPRLNQQNANRRTPSMGNNPGGGRKFQSRNVTPRRMTSLLVGGVSSSGGKGMNTPEPKGNNDDDLANRILETLGKMSTPLDSVRNRHVPSWVTPRASRARQQNKDVDMPPSNSLAIPSKIRGTWASGQKSAVFDSSTKSKPSNMSNSSSMFESNTSKTINQAQQEQQHKKKPITEVVMIDHDDDEEMDGTVDSLFEGVSVTYAFTPPIGQQTCSDSAAVLARISNADMAEFVFDGESGVDDRNSNRNMSRSVVHKLTDKVSMVRQQHQQEQQRSGMNGKAVTMNFSVAPRSPTANFDNSAQEQSKDLSQMFSGGEEQRKEQRNVDSSASVSGFGKRSKDALMAKLGGGSKGRSRDIKAMTTSGKTSSDSERQGDNNGETKRKKDAALSSSDDDTDDESSVALARMKKTKQADANGGGGEKVNPLARFLLRADQYKCESCGVHNENSSSECVSCEVARPASVEVAVAAVEPAVPKVNPLARFLLRADQWKCESCGVHNENTSSECVSCEVARPESVASTTSSTSPSSSKSDSKPPAAEPAFKFGGAPVATAATTPTIQFGSSVSSSSSSSSTATPAFNMFGGSSTSKSDSGEIKFGSSAVAAPAPSTEIIFGSSSTLVAATTTTTTTTGSGGLFGALATSAPAAATTTDTITKPLFGGPSAITTTTTSSNLFGGSGAVVAGAGLFGAASATPSTATLFETPAAAAAAHTTIEDKSDQPKKRSRGGNDEGAKELPASKPATGSSLFGGSSSDKRVAGGSIFGGPPAALPVPKDGGLFGANAAAVTSSNIFGGASSSSSSSAVPTGLTVSASPAGSKEVDTMEMSPLGKKADTSTTVNFGTGSGFGGATTTGPESKSNLFGAPTPAVSLGGGGGSGHFVFGGAAPAAPSTSANPLFGGAASSAPVSSNPLFGGPAAPTSTVAPTPAAPVSTNPLFGGGGTAAPSGSIFGGGAQQQQPPRPSSGLGGGGIFGGTAAAPAVTPNPFGAAQPPAASGSNMFGAPAASNQFGSQQPQAVAPSPFGQPPAQQQQQSNPFGGGMQQHPGFGQPQQQQFGAPAAPVGGVFGGGAPGGFNAGPAPPQQGGMFSMGTSAAPPRTAGVQRKVRRRPKNYGARK